MKLKIPVFFFILLYGFFILQPQVFAHKPSQIVRFAQVSDTHISNSGKDTSRRLWVDSTKLFQDVVDQINQEPSLDFTLFSGDLVELPTQENLTDFVSIAKKLKNPWYLALGNHDVSKEGKLLKPEVIDILYKNSTTFNTKGYYTFVLKEKLKFIILDGTPDKGSTTHGVFSQQQIDWFQAQVQADPEKFIIVVLHFPIVEPFHSKTHHILEPAASKLKKIINQNTNVRLVLTGHYHSASIKVEQHTIHAACPAIIEYPNAFRVITIFDDGTVKLEWRETTFKELQNKSKARSKWYKTSYGQQKDRMATLNHMVESQNK